VDKIMSTGVPRPRWKLRYSGEQSVGSHVIYDGAARARSRDYGRRTKFIAHFNSHSQPSTELLVLFAQTLHSFNAAFVKDNMLLWHVCRPRYVSGELRCSFVSGNSRKSARFVILRVEAPPLTTSPLRNAGVFKARLERQCMAPTIVAHGRNISKQAPQSQIKQQTQGFRTFLKVGVGVFSANFSARGGSKAKELPVADLRAPKNILEAEPWSLWPCLAHVPGWKDYGAGTTLSRPCCRLRHRRKHSPQFGRVNRVVATP